MHSDGLAQVGQHCPTALRCWLHRNSVKPPSQVRIVGPVNAVVFQATPARKNRAVGKRVLIAGNQAGHEFAASPLLVDHAVKPLGFVGIHINHYQV